MSTVQEAFRLKFERIIHGDTGSGGLMNSSSAACIRGVYFAVKPSTEAYPHIWYNATFETEPYSTSTTASVLTANINLVVDIFVRRADVPVNPGTYSSGDAHHFGFHKAATEGTIAAILARLRTALETQSNWGQEASGNQTWFFAAPVLQNVGAGERDGADYAHLRLNYTLSGAQTSSTNGVATGFGAGFSIVLYSPNNASTATIMSETGPFAYALSQRLNLVDSMRKRDIEERYTHAERGGLLSVRFLVSPESSAWPKIAAYQSFKISRSPGRIFRVTLQLSSGKTDTFFGFLESFDIAQSKTGGWAQGSFTMRTSAPSIAGSFDDGGQSFGPFADNP